jgi:LPXTG-motif cell wall-anchored protein
VPWRPPGIPRPDSGVEVEALPRRWAERIFGGFTLSATGADVVSAARLAGLLVLAGAVLLAARWRRRANAR